MAKLKAGSLVCREAKLFRGRMFQAGQPIDETSADCSAAELAEWRAKGWIETVEEMTARLKAEPDVPDAGNEGSKDG